MEAMEAANGYLLRALPDDLKAQIDLHTYPWDVMVEIKKHCETQNPQLLQEIHLSITSVGYFEGDDWSVYYGKKLSSYNSLKGTPFAMTEVDFSGHVVDNIVDPGFRCFKLDFWSQPGTIARLEYLMSCCKRMMAQEDRVKFPVEVDSKPPPNISTPAANVVAHVTKYNKKRKRSSRKPEGCSFCIAKGYPSRHRSVSCWSDPTSEAYLGKEYVERKMRNLKKRNTKTEVSNLAVVGAASELEAFLRSE